MRERFLGRNDLSHSINFTLMKKIITLIFLLVTGFVSVQAQRYLVPTFSSVTVTPNVKYATNITVVTGSPAQQDLTMDVYMPTGDTEESRPVVVYFHTGSFLPQYFNKQITGGKQDSTVVEICTRLAKLGYVAVAATYRAGWNPSALGPTGQNIRTGTLLNAAYRGIQDARSCYRFLRKSVAEDGNPYGIDPEKIVAWGQGTGGYISLGSAYLDRFEEVSTLDKFIDTGTLLPYVDTSLVGDVYGLVNRPLCIANTPGYSSDIKMAINMGGALGDISWIEGDAATYDEPATIGFHMVNDPFAPFADGPVIVPTTGDFVVNVSGSRTAVGAANDLGVNDPLAAINASLLANGDGLTQLMTAFKPVVLPTPPFQPVGITLGADNLYPFRPTGVSQYESGPWDWWNKNFLDVLIPQINAVYGTNFNSDTLHYSGLITNPNMSATKARAYIDTVMAFYIPRGCAVLGLTECCEALGAMGIDCGLTSTEEVIGADVVGLRMNPNPAEGYVFIQSAPEHPMQSVEIFDLNGQLLQGKYNINSHQHVFERGDLPGGMYIVKARFGDNIAAQKVIFR